MTVMEKMVKDLYMHKLVKNPEDDIGKCGYVINLQVFIDGINNPTELVKRHFSETK